MSRKAFVLRPRAVRSPEPSSSAVSSVRLARGARALTLVAAALLVGAASGCDGWESTSGSGGSGAGGEGGASGCLVVPQPTFALRVLVEAGGPLPPDTTVEVMWSAGKEPPFHLDDPSSWGTLDTANIVCDVDPAGGPPLDLEVLSCELWTSSPTEVRVSAKGHVTEQSTYTAEPPEECNPEPTPIEVELSLAHR